MTEQTPRIKELFARLERERQAGLKASRWGEARRFAGKRDGNHLARIDHIISMIDKEYTKLERQVKEHI